MSARAALRTPFSAYGQDVSPLVGGGTRARMAQDDPSSMMSDALAELAGLLLGAESFDDLAEQIAQLAARTLPTAATCAITVSVADRAMTVATADPLGRLLDEQQYDIDEGPCLEAIRTRAT